MTELAERLIDSTIGEAMPNVGSIVKELDKMQGRLDSIVATLNKSKDKDLMRAAKDLSEAADTVEGVVNDLEGLR